MRVKIVKKTRLVSDLKTNTHVLVTDRNAKRGKKEEMKHNDYNKDTARTLKE